MAAVDREQTTMGSVMNRLTYAGDNAGQISRNTTSSRSRMSDADYAAATTDVVRKQIIQQASMAMLAQANQQPSAVLNLLQ
jgi:flagellin